MAKSTAERQRDHRKRAKAMKQVSDRVIDAAFVVEINRAYVKGGKAGFDRGMVAYAKKLNLHGGAGAGGGRVAEKELARLYAFHSQGRVIPPIGDQAAWLTFARNAGAKQGEALAEKCRQEVIEKMRSIDRLDQLPPEDGGTMANTGLGNAYCVGFVKVGRR